MDSKQLIHDLKALRTKLCDRYDYDDAASVRLAVELIEAWSLGQQADDRRIEALRPVRNIVNALNQVTTQAERDGDEHVVIHVERSSYAMFPSNVRESIRAIEALMKERPEPADARECVEAINRAKHRGEDSWALVVETHACASGMRLEEDELLGLGRLLIERERAVFEKKGA